MLFQGKKWKEWGRLSLGSLLVLLVLLLDLLAAAPKLHEQFHADAGQSQHQCLVTLFAHGQVDAAGLDVPFVIPVGLATPARQIVFTAFAPAIENLPAGRAPPVSASPLV